MGKVWNLCCLQEKVYLCKPKKHYLMKHLSFFMIMLVFLATACMPTRNGFAKTCSVAVYGITHTKQLCIRKPVKYEYKKEKNMENPFFTRFNTPYQVPPFDKIDTSHYLPAFIEGMKQHKAEIDKIATNQEAAGFENTILAFDKSGEMLYRVKRVFDNITEAHTNEQLQALQKKISPMITGHFDDIYMNEKLFGRIREVYENRSGSGLDSQQVRVIEKYYRDFERRGANLPKEKQAELRKINESLSLLSVNFSDNLLTETNKNFLLVIEDRKDLEGLPEEVINGAAEAAKERQMEHKWVFTLAKPSWIPFLQYAKNRGLREQIYKAWYMRGDNGNANDNKAILSEIVNLRIQKANLLGYENFAAYMIAENMAKTPDQVNQFLARLWEPALKVAKSELSEMQKISDKEGNTFKLASWDWWYYAEKLRKEKYDLDESELKPYFSLNHVRDGMFELAKRLYGINFHQLTDLPVYTAGVETFQVKEADGRHLGIIYLDYFPRDSKRGGAWCTDFQPATWRDGKKVDPVISIVCNFTPPAGNTPSLLNWDEVNTLFHEFGHALHGLFTEGLYDRTAGVVPQDYVELPSQIMENWAAEPEVLKLYAKHYQTGEVIPDALIGKISSSRLFNQGFETTEYLAASILDQEYHQLSQPFDKQVDVFEADAMAKQGLISEIIPRYRSTYFAHVFSGSSYAAGYYVYIWAAVLDADAFAAFKSSGDLFNPQLAAKFRKYCLAECGNDDAMVQYRKFRGQEPSLEPLLKRRGLL